MDYQNDFQIKTVKQLLDEQIIHEEGRFKFAILSKTETTRLLERSLTRMKSSKWALRGIEQRFFTSRYIFERIT